MSAEPTDYVVVTTVQGPVEEEQMRSFLEAHDIPVHTRGEAIRRIHTTTIDGIAATDIEVPARFVRAARELLERVERGELRLPDDFEEVAGDEA